MTDSVLARVAAPKTTPTPALKSMWRDLFETEPPPYNRRFLESRLAYRIQGHCHVIGLVGGICGRKCPS